MKQALATLSFQTARLEKGLYMCVAGGGWGKGRHCKDEFNVSDGCCHDSTCVVPPTVHPLLKWQADGGQMGKKGGGRGSSEERI